MKGIVFNLLEECVTDAHGADTWDDMLERAGVDGVYTSLGSYPDADLVALVGAASELLARPADDVVRWFGEAALPLLAQAYPDFFTPHVSTLPFLLTLNDVIHPEVRKLYPGADVPVFDFAMDGDDALLMGYASGRVLCSLAEGFIAGTGAHFGEDVVIAQEACMKDGAERCLIRVTLAR